ncbi:DUF1206 domain-containing protein [Actinomycetospora straminea]|uniref:DUF1206 domain-containing protein n=1 Tax=Actinomycetospora straminea TaxID=663607 RepID=A0ABP9ED08_9PSEU|nr:DUF1206 domain-containing protein [Actinomycetospora straminea]MDD7935370.1 DUF1206 domain-containing protein [Actinomycetospora straminea]
MTTSEGAERVEEAAGHAVHEAADRALHGGGDAPSRLVELLGRAGLVAYGAVHLLVAGLGLRLAFGQASEVDQQGAVSAVAAVGFVGVVLLVLFVAGLVAFALWQITAVVAGFRWVSGGERFRKRVGAAAKAIAVLAVAVVAARTVLGEPEEGRAGPQKLVVWLLALPLGWLLVAAIAVTVVVIAGTMVYTGLARTFMGDLVDDLPGWARRAAVVLGAVGNLARAVAFGAVGVLFGVAAINADPARVGGLDEALRVLVSQWQGVTPLVAISLGLAAFGAYCFLDARYRRAY